MELSFSIIRNSGQRNRIRNMLFLSIPVLIILQFLLHEFNLPVLGWISTSFLGIVILLSFLITRIYPRYDIIGAMTFANSTVNILDKIVRIELISSISIFYDNFRGETSKVTLLSYYEGDKNWIQIKLKTGEIIKHSFLSTSKHDYRAIADYLKKYSIKGVPIELDSKKGSLKY